MNGFFKGVLVGVGVGMLVAPMKGEEMRRQLGDRISTLRGYLPEDANMQLNQYTQQVTQRVAQTGNNLKGYAQQAASKVKETGSTLGDLAQKAGTDVKSTAQDTANITKQNVSSVKQQSTSSTANLQ